jgi:hypothetical protein
MQMQWFVVFLTARLALSLRVAALVAMVASAFMPKVAIADQGSVRVWLPDMATPLYKISAKRGIGRWQESIHRSVANTSK